MNITRYPELVCMLYTPYITQDSKLNRSRNRGFLNFCLVGPRVGPEAELEVSSFPQHNLMIMMID